ncbi:MAG: hypothetical protein ACK4K7_10315 [Allosphingosinicella sp.]|uniref:hypothetical protein n=1 Tax=Allosphingosinicella sp. TaxID=2823234 RepID=UPI003959D678
MMLQILYWTTLAACLLFALKRGGADERIGAAVIAVGSLLSVGAAAAPNGRFQAAETGILIVDLAVLAAFLALALRSERFWPLWATGFHLVAVVTHGAMMVSPGVVPRAYALAQGFWAYPMLFAIAIGTSLLRPPPPSPPPSTRRGPTPRPSAP